MAVRHASCSAQGALAKIGYIRDSIQMDIIKLFTSIKQICKLDFEFGFFYLSKANISVSFGSSPTGIHSSAMQMHNIF